MGRHEVSASAARGAAVESSRAARLGVAATLAVVFTLLYAVTLAGSDAIFEKGIRSFFWSDVGEWTFATQIGAVRGDLGLEELALPPYTRGGAPPPDFARHWELKRSKHPLFAAASHWVYRAVRAAARPFAAGGDAREGWTYRHERIALKFPSALFGGLATAGFFWMASAYAGAGTALLFALFFGVSFGKWFFASVPDSYSLQALLSVGFAAQLFASGRSLAALAGLAATTVAAIFIGVNNVLLVPVGAAWLILEERRRDAIAYAAITGVAVVAAYGAMTLLVEDSVTLGGTIDLVSRQVEAFSQRSSVEVGGPLVKLAFSLVGFSLIGVAAAPAAEELYHSFAVLGAYATSPLSLAFLVSYAALFGVIVHRLVTGPPVPRESQNRLMTLALWVGALLLYYSQFNALQTILYTSLFLVPFVALLCEGFALRPASRVEFALLGALVATTLASNLVFLRQFVP